MRYALHAEWTKARTVRGPGLLVLAVIVLTVGLGAIVTDSAAVAAHTAAGAAGAGGAGQDTAVLCLSGVQLGQAVVAILAAQAVGGEYSSRLIHVTLVATPKRLTALAAKAGVVSALTLVAALPAVAISVLARRLVLSAHGFAVPSPASGAELRAAAGSVLYLLLIALLSLGLALLIRDTGIAIGAVLALLYLFPLIGHAFGNPHWQRHLEQISPMTAGLLIQRTTNLNTLPLSPWQGLAVLAAWSASVLLGGALALRLRDA
jgi:ABC-2 type transport system permease protein